MFWNTSRHRLLYHPLCLSKMCLQPHHHALHLCQSPVKRIRFNNLLHHVDVQPEFPASSADDDPMSFPHVDDTPPWVYQEPETPWISTEQDTPVIISQQVPLPPIQVSPSREKTNMSTGDSIIPLPPWFDSHRPQVTKMFHHRSLRVKRLHL